RIFQFAQQFPLSDVQPELYALPVLRFVFGVQSFSFETCQAIAVEVSGMAFHLALQGSECGSYLPFRFKVGLEVSIIQVTIHFVSQQISSLQSRILGCLFFLYKNRLTSKPKAVL